MTFCLVRHASLILLVSLWSATAPAAPWEFGEPVTVSASRHGVFHHLEAAGRQSIAVSAGTVAVVWEDNRDGKPRAFVAFRAAGTSKFVSQPLSGKQEAYAPVVVALPQGGFVFGWEEGGQAWVSMGGPGGIGAALQLSRAEATQITLGAGEPGVFAAWSERSGKHMSIQFSSLKFNSTLSAEPAQVVDAAQTGDQLYPALSVLKSAVVLAWEDRRNSFTEIVHARTQDGKKFSKIQVLNARRRQKGTRLQDYGRGPGATRVALARFDDERAVAVWLDKRNFLGGYDVYAALSEPGGGRFQSNEKVQDEFGNNFGQWHVVIAAHAGLVAVAWDDDRDGSPDIWLSWREDSGWSGDVGVPGANGSGIDASPAMVMDESGHLYLAWITQQKQDAPTSLRFIEARLASRRPGSP